MKRIAVTGGIAAGKTQVAELLRKRGWPVIDADAIGHELLREDRELVRRIEQCLGPGLLDEQGAVLRSRLAGIVFSDPGALEALNELVFPYLYRNLQLKVRSAPGPAVFVDAALIFEWGVEDDFDEVWVVWARDELRVSRLMSRTGLTRDEACRRVASQLPQQEKIERADRRLENSGSPDQLERALDAVLSSAGLLDPGGRPDSKRRKDRE